MEIKEIVAAIAEKPPAPDQLQTAADELNMSLDELLESIAREIAEGYLRGIYSWAFGDSAMNNLFATAYGLSDICLPKFAFDVYIAFDEGEYIHKESPELDGEPRTKALLKPIVGEISA
jgi:hypothetical protein